MEVVVELCYCGVKNVVVKIGDCGVICVIKEEVFF